MPAATEEQINRIMGKTPIVPHKMIWRDDDIGDHEEIGQFDFARFKRADELFKKFGFTHTVAVIVKGFSSKRDVIKYIRDNPHIDPQLHCYNHLKPLAGMEAGQLIHDLTLSLKIMENIFCKKPTTIYPPWNEVDDQLRSVAAQFGLQVKEEKLSLPQYIRVKGHVKEDTINFHHWSDEDYNQLEKALAIYKEMGWDDK